MIFDPLGQYVYDYSKFPAVRRDLSRYTLVTDDPAKLREYFREKGQLEPFRILYWPRKGREIDHWRKVAIGCYETGNMLVCVDEAGLLCENGQFRIDKKGHVPMLEELVHRGRHRSVDIVCTAQRPTDIARRYTSQSTDLRIFNTTENNDLTYLQERVGQSAAERLPSLPKYTYLHWTPDGVNIYQPKGG